MADGRQFNEKYQNENFTDIKWKSYVDDKIFYTEWGKKNEI